MFAFRKAGTQVSPVNNVTPLPKNRCCTLFALFIKGPLKRGWGLLLFALDFWFGGLLGALA
jgi:hypothetical protein